MHTRTKLMPSIIDLIEKRKLLKNKAHTYYSAIERTYSNSYYPMNVPDATAGKSTRPLHNNDFVLARAYFRVSKKDIDAETRETFSHTFYSESEANLRLASKSKEAESKDTESQKDAVISDEFIANVRDFIEDLTQYQQMRTAFKTIPTRDSIDYRAILEKHALHLIREDFTPEIIMKAGAAVITRLAQREQKSEATFVPNLENLIEIDDKFSSTGVRMIFACIDDGDEYKVAPETEADQSARLTALFRRLGNANVIADFQEVFCSCHFHEHLLKATQELMSRQWRPGMFFSPAQEAHAEKFKATLAEINQPRERTPGMP